ncbi:HU family DNA-binding protein [Rhodobacter sp. Har01]|uniref:HU family DNA-binding protein n=1 Tax=Rhodobacter sp. Har01 TaxID=2883999 RepID=UPI001D066876|nr:HU family DNA-binding protein [Rhodobacter sp. Har01]MCB6177189.1 HU family DNA-binding protein [Rhodobacter sp. Har01]
MATPKKTAPKARKAVPKAMPAAVLEIAPVAEAAGAEAPEADVAAQAKVRAPSLRLKELVDHVSASTGAKKPAVKEIVTATVMALGDALGRGDELNLPGFGRARIARQTERDGASHLTLKVRRGPHKRREAGDTEPLAEDGEDS